MKPTTPLARYNSAQFSELRRIHDEIKWLAGEELHYDPETTPSGRKIVEDTFAQVILDRNAGKWLAGLPEMKDLHDMVERAVESEGGGGDNDLPDNKSPQDSS